MGWDDYETHLSDQDTLDLCKKIKAVVDDRAEAYYPSNMSGVARVDIGGNSFEQMVVDPKGEPNNFLSDAEMRSKFDTLVAPYLDPDSLDQLAKGILHLDDQKNIHGLLDLTRSEPAATLKAVLSRTSMVVERKEVGPGRYRESYGRYFEDFQIGDIYEHRPGRTITEADNTWFTLLTMNTHPIHFDG